MTPSLADQALPDLGALHTQLRTLIASSRQRLAGAVNAELTRLYWAGGERLRNDVPGGRDRAKYGTKLLDPLGAQLAQEFGRGFAFVERQKRMVIDGDDFYLDLLFYHRRLRRLVAIELKLGRFKEVQEAARVFYLAATRATQRLLVAFSGDCGYGARL